MTTSINKKTTGALRVLLALILILPGLANAASISTQGCLGVSNFSCEFDSEFNNGALFRSRAEHNGTLIPASLAFTGTVSGHSDIASGTLHSFGAVSSNSGDPSSEGLDGGVIFGGSGFSDDVSFTNTLSGPFDVTINMYVSGQINSDGADVFAGAFLNLGGETDSGSYSSDGAINDVLSATITLTNNNPIDISASLDYSVDTYPGGGAATDVELSAYIELIIEDEIIFSSESGLFLATPVPVPPALPMLLGGLAGLVTVTRRRACA